MVTITPLAEKNIEAAAQSLSRAFMNDPLQQYVFPDAKERAQKSPALFKAYLRFGGMFGEVYATQNIAGAVVWLPPGATDVNPEKAEKAGLNKIPELLGESAAARFFSVIDFLDPFHKLDVEEPHWYTMVIGVDPAYCGLGYGKALMHHVMEKAENRKTTFYLETAQPANVHFYTQLGFKVVRELKEPQSQLPLWIFKKMY